MIWDFVIVIGCFWLIALAVSLAVDYIEDFYRRKP